MHVGEIFSKTENGCRLTANSMNKKGKKGKKHRSENQDCAHTQSQIRKNALEVKGENTTWKVRAYGIYVRVGNVSEIERVRAQRKSEMLCKSTFPCCICCIICILRHSSFKTIVNLKKYNTTICRATAFIRFGRVIIEEKSQ